jgi:hypothetical protein
MLQERISCTLVAIARLKKPLIANSLITPRQKATDNDPVFNLYIYIYIYIYLPKINSTVT